MERIKAELLKHLTKSGKYEIAATEVETLPGYKADIAGFTGTHYYEFEIKKVLIDAIEGELYKVRKHKYYSKLDRLISRIPNYFVLVIPEEIVDPVIARLSELNVKYGIMAYKIEEDIYHFKYVKEPSILHNKPASLIKKCIYKRMISDNVDLVLSSNISDLSDTVTSKDRRISFLERKLREKDEELNQIKTGIFQGVPLIAKTNVYAEKVTIHYTDGKTKSFKVKS